MFNVTKARLIAPTFAVMLLSIGLQACNNDSGTPINSPNATGNTTGNTTDTGSNPDTSSEAANDASVTVTEANLDQTAAGVSANAVSPNFEAELNPQLIAGARVVQRSWRRP